MEAVAERQPPPPPPLPRQMEPIVRERSRRLRRRRLLAKRLRHWEAVHNAEEERNSQQKMRASAEADNPLTVFRRPLASDGEKWRLRLPPRALATGEPDTGWDVDGYRTAGLLSARSMPSRTATEDGGNDRATAWPLSARRHRDERPAGDSVDGVRGGGQGRGGAAVGGSFVRAAGAYTMLGEGVQFEGNMMFDQALDVGGECKGDFVSNGRGRLRVRRGGKIVGDVFGAEEVVVDGVVEGNLTAARVRLLPRAVVTGEVMATEEMVDDRMSQAKMRLLRKQLRRARRSGDSVAATFGVTAAASSLAEAIRKGRAATQAHAMPSARPPTLQQHRSMASMTVKPSQRRRMRRHARVASTGVLPTNTSSTRRPAVVHPSSPQRPAAANPSSPQRPAAANPSSPHRPAAANPSSPHRPAAANPSSRHRPTFVHPSSPRRPAAANPPSPRHRPTRHVPQPVPVTSLTLRQRVVRSRLQLLRQRTSSSAIATSHA